jgi:hypothetical protein
MTYLDQNSRNHHIESDTESQWICVSNSLQWDHSEMECLTGGDKETPRNRMRINAKFRRMEAVSFPQGYLDDVPMITVWINIIFIH